MNEQTELFEYRPPIWDAPRHRRIKDIYNSGQQSQAVDEGLE